MDNTMRVTAARIGWGLVLIVAAAMGLIVDMVRRLGKKVRE